MINRFNEKKIEVHRKRLPRGSASLPRKVVDEEHQARIISALTKVVASKGYANTTIDDIIKSAKVSKSTFYHLFKDKEDCFIFAFRLASTEHVQSTLSALNDVNLPLKQRLSAALLSYFDIVNNDFDAALAYIAEAENSTLRSRAAYYDVQVLLVAELQKWLIDVRKEYPNHSSRYDIDFSLMLSGLSGHLVNQVRLSKKFTIDDVRAIHRYMLACMGLYDWAEENVNINLAPLT